MTKLENGFIEIKIEGEYRMGSPYNEEVKLCNHVSFLGKRCDGESSEYGGVQEVLCYRCKKHFVISELIN